MIDKFKAKFVEESLDNVHDLEEALLLLENDTENNEIIERIFRAMHSLKGGGAMFGFNDLSEFTHHLETVFDLVRNNKLAVTNDLISLTFNAVDQIKFLLDRGDLENTEELNDQKEFIDRIKRFLAKDSQQVSTKKTSTNSELDGSLIAKEDNNLNSYLITFKPNADILQNGTNPLYLIDDLYALGKAKVLSSYVNVPNLDKLLPIEQYVNWQIVLSSKEPANEIKDVFIFVEDECKLDIQLIQSGNLIENSEFEALFNLKTSSQSFFTIDELKQLSDSEDKDNESKKEKKKVVFKEHKISSIRVASNKIDELVTLVSELVTIQAQLNLYAEKNGEPGIVNLSENIQKLTRQLRDNAFEISLIPLQNELMRFQRLVRDLSKDLSKEIDFVIEGGDIELDKNIIEHLTDPLLHMIRNSVDHGIESPEDRIKKGKSPRGTILFKAFYSGPSVIIKLIDDGKGIDTDWIYSKAVEKGLINSNIELTRKEIFDLVFLSGFSTKEVVSDVSGRGVGMDVVKRKISEIRGEVSIDSEVNVGTTLTLELPLTLSIIDGLLVKVANIQYVIPISVIEKIFAINEELLSSSFNNVVVIEGQQYPIIKLREIFVEKEQDRFTGKEHIILIKYEERKIGLLVDEVIGEYQTVVKPLGRILKSQEIISGATILGDGSISLVMDTNRLVHYNSMKKIRSNNPAN